MADRGEVTQEESTFHSAKQREREELYKTRRCCRCGKNFEQINNHALECFYHPGQSLPMGEGGMDSPWAYSCCGALSNLDDRAGLLGRAPEPRGCVSCAHSSSAEEGAPHSIVLPLLEDELTNSKIGYDQRNVLGKIRSVADADMDFSAPTTLRPRNRVRLSASKTDLCCLVLENLRGLREGESDPYGLGVGWEDNWNRDRALHTAWISNSASMTTRVVFRAATSASVSTEKIKANLATMSNEVKCRDHIESFLNKLTALDAVEPFLLKQLKVILNKRVR